MASFEGHESDAIDSVCARQLSAIGDLAEWASGAEIPLWLRGGWAMDFALGTITRPHADIDWFVDVANAARVRDHLVEQGWVVSRTQLNAVDLVREGEGLDHGIGFVQRRGEDVVVPNGPYAGDLWPSGMLEGLFRTLHGVTCRTITVEAQIEIKRMMPVWMPGLPRRAQDALDIERLGQLG